MLTQLKNWLGIGKAGDDNTPLDLSGYHPDPVRRATSATSGARRPTPGGNGSIERRKGERRRQQSGGDTDRVPTLSILDDPSPLGGGSTDGFDPYNTGDFDRSRNWERRFRD
jgi:hypothetical protein